MEEVLGLPVVDLVQTRKNVRLLFEVYRQYRANFEHGTELPVKPVPELQKYQDAVDPGTRRAINKPSSGERPPDEREIMMERFMRDVERKVDKLALLRKAILRTKFMGDEELTDVEAMDELDLQGVCVSEATYQRHKRSAIRSIAFAMKVVSYK